MSPATRQAAYLKKRDLSSISHRWVNWLLPFVVICAIFIWAGNHLSNPATLPVNKIQVHGAFVNVDEAMLHRVIDGVVAGGYFNADVEYVRKVVEQLPWVSKASVRRVWPDTLSISVKEQQPVAVSKQLGLINAEGDVFKPANNFLNKELPVFEGKASLNKLMLSKYYEMNKILTTINRKITYLKLDARLAVELKLDNGLKVVLGRGQTVNRLERLMNIYPKTLARHIENIEVIDLRYTNGMAIGWKKYKGILGDMKHV